MKRKQKYSDLIDGLIEQYLKKYKDYKNEFYIDKLDILMDLQNLDKNKIYEGLITSYDIDTVLKNIRYDYHINNIIKIQNRIRIYLIKDFHLCNKEIDIFKTEKNKTDFIELLNSYGWYISSFQYSKSAPKFFDINDNIQKILNDKDVSYFHCSLENKFDIKEINIPDILYHISPKIYRNKILRNGLIPKTDSNKMINHPDRLYAFKNKVNFKKFEVDSINNHKISKDSILKNKKWNNNKLEYDVYKINTKYSDVVWFNDRNHFNALYTMENISPNSIKIIETFEIFNNEIKI